MYSSNKQSTSYKTQSPDRQRSSSGSRRRHREDEYSEQDTQQILAETKNVRNQTLSVTRDAVSRLRQTEETAQNSMVMLDGQSEKLYKAQSDMNLAKAHQKNADDKISELKRLSKWFTFGNLFRKSKSEKRLAEARLKNDYEERMRDDSDVISGRNESKRNKEATSNKLRQKDGKPQIYESSVKYASDLLDEEDKAAEEEIEANLDDIMNVTSRLKAMAQGMSTEVENQNRVISKLDKGADEVNVRVIQANNRMKKY